MLVLTAKGLRSNCDLFPFKIKFASFFHGKFVFITSIIIYCESGIEEIWWNMCRRAHAAYVRWMERERKENKSNENVPCWGGWLCRSYAVKRRIWKFLSAEKKTHELWNLQNPFFATLQPRFIKAHLFFQPHRFCLVMDLWVTQKTFPSSFPRRKENNEKFSERRGNFFAPFERIIKSLSHMVSQSWMMKVA